MVLPTSRSVRANQTYTGNLPGTIVCILFAHSFVRNIKLREAFLNRLYLFYSSKGSKQKDSNANLEKNKNDYEQEIKKLELQVNQIKERESNLEETLNEEKSKYEHLENTYRIEMQYLTRRLEENDLEILNLKELRKSDKENLSLAPNENCSDGIDKSVLVNMKKSLDRAAEEILRLNEEQETLLAFSNKNMFLLNKLKGIHSSSSTSTQLS